MCKSWRSSRPEQGNTPIDIYGFFVLQLPHRTTKQPHKLAQILSYLIFMGFAIGTTPRVCHMSGRRKRETAQGASFPTPATVQKVKPVAAATGRMRTTPHASERLNRYLLLTRLVLLSLQNGFVTRHDLARVFPVQNGHSMADHFFRADHFLHCGNRFSEGDQTCPT